MIVLANNAVAFQSLRSILKRTSLRMSTFSIWEYKKNTIKLFMNDFFFKSYINSFYGRNHILLPFVHSLLYLDREVSS